MNPKRDFKFHDPKIGSALHVKIIPRSSKDEIVGIMANGVVKIRITAPPVDGKANKAIVDYLAKVLKIPHDRIEIVAGLSGKEKLITLTGYSSEELDKTIKKHLAKKA